MQKLRREFRLLFHIGMIDAILRKEFCYLQFLGGSAKSKISFARKIN